MSAKPKQQKRFQRRLILEQLDDRILMSVSPPQAVTVESYNLYLGADLAPVLESLVLGSPEKVVIDKTKQFWKDVTATKFNERADAIVKQIVANKPDLIGLQEVMTYYTGVRDGVNTLNGDKPNATTEVLNFLKVLKNKLAAKGLPYETLKVTTENDFELPATIGGVPRDLRMKDEVAILARKDLVTAGVQFSNPLGKPFAAKVTSFTLTGKLLVVQRGWNSIDVDWGGSKFRFVNMCLEVPAFPLTQAFQAAEIVAGPAATTLPVILVGDSNIYGGDNSNWLTHQVLVGAGFKDAWVQTHPGDPGYTFGNQPDLKNKVALQPDPTNPMAKGYHPSRMDRVYHRGPFQATSMNLVGLAKTVSGLWPSDHAGVVARLAVTSPLAKSTALPGQVAASLWSDPAALAQVTDAASRIVPDSPQLRLDPITTPSNRCFYFGGPAGKARPETSVVIDRLMADDAWALRSQADMDSQFGDEG